MIIQIFIIFTIKLDEKVVIFFIIWALLPHENGCFGGFIRLKKKKLYHYVSDTHTQLLTNFKPIPKEKGIFGTAY